MDGHLSGKLLVATPVLRDPNFRRTVVLVCAHGEDGAMGVVLNRPLPAAVADHLPTWSERVSAPGALFDGGPVERESVIGLAAASANFSGDGWKPVSDRVGLVDLNLLPDERETAFERVRIFAGYAGWAAGQLEAEIGTRAWFVVDARASDVFTADPDELWRHVLMRQPLEQAMYAYYPSTRGLNLN